MLLIYTEVFLIHIDMHEYTVDIHWRYNLLVYVEMCYAKIEPTTSLQVAKEYLKILMLP